MSEKLGPLPKPVLETPAWIKSKIRNRQDEGFFSADQMRAYAAQEVEKERERCASECRAMAEGLHDPLNNARAAVATELERRIRVA